MSVNSYNQHAEIRIGTEVFSISCGGEWKSANGKVPRVLDAWPWDKGFVFEPESCYSRDSFAEQVEACAKALGAEILHLDRIPANAPCMQIDQLSAS